MSGGSSPAPPRSWPRSTRHWKRPASSPVLSELTMVPTTTVEVSSESEAKKVLRLIEAFDDHDDVQNVYANFDIPDAVMAAYRGVKSPVEIPRPVPPDGVASNACSSWESTPACPVVATASSPVGAAPWRAVAGGVISTASVGAPSPTAAHPVGGVAGAGGRVRSRCRGGRAGVLPGERPHRHGHRPGRRSRPGGGGRVRLRSGPVHVERGQAGPGRLRRRHQGPGPEDGGLGPRPEPRPPGRPTWPTPWPWPPAISPPSPCGGRWRAATGDPS